MCTKVMINFERLTIYKGFFLYLSLFTLKVKEKFSWNTYFAFREVNDLFIKWINVILYLRFCDVESKLECGGV
mgnify:CR=1 FL=1